MRSVRVMASEGYKFGDFTKQFLKDVKTGLDDAGKKATGNAGYEFGDYSNALLENVKERAKEMDLQGRSAEALEKLRSYEFGSISKSLLNSEVGQQFLSTATEAGRKVSGDPNYEIGDFSRNAVKLMEGAKTRAEKMMALPDDVTELKQILLEQQLLIQSLTGEQYATSERVDQVLRIDGPAGELKPVLLDNQEVIDVLLVSKDELDRTDP